MKILRNWLLELCDLDRVPTADEIAAALTAVGLEIEGVTDLGAGFSGVVVAEVTGLRPHPSSDKLRLVDVITAPGGPATQVVCGAPNVPAPGGRVLWAQPGAKLPGGLTLATKPVKGVDSPGMLCAEDELGIGDDEAGIIVLDADDRTPLGAPAQLALGVDDVVLELSVPANRPDVLGHVGVARELVARLGGRLVLPTTLAPVGGEASGWQVGLEDAGVRRYVAQVLRGVTVGPSPRKFAQRLRSVGVRPISNVVDVTNYVMFELGQPLHAFDAARLGGQRLGVRSARVGEMLTTLDGQARQLAATDLVIVDGSRGERAVALAGVMGGQATEVTSATTDLALESASFDPRRIKATARRVGLHSESSLRFERGVDPELAGLAAARATHLLQQLAGATVVGPSLDMYPAPPRRARVPLRRSRLTSLTGVEFAAAEVDAALTRLGCEVATTDGADATIVTVPTWRTDLAREVDLIEDVLRVLGMDRVPSTMPALRAANPLLAIDVGDAGGADEARAVLAGAGLAEAITFGFQSFARLEALALMPGDRRARPIALRNPMSVDQAIMRTSLLPNLLAAVARNISFGHRDVAMFEVGPVFLRRDEQNSDVEPRSLADEEQWVTAVLVGQRPGQLGGGASWDFFDARGLLDRLIAVRGRGSVAATYAATTEVPYLHPGLAATVSFGDASPAGTVGEVHPAVRERLGIDRPVFVFDVRLAAMPRGGAPQMRAIPRFPGSSRDVSLLMPDHLPAQRVRDIVAEVREPLVEALHVREDYRDAKLPAGRKSMLWSVDYRAADRTLTDAELDAVHERVVARLVTELPAERR